MPEQTLSLQAEDWLQQLVSLNADIIDSVVYMPNTSTSEDFGSPTGISQIGSAHVSPTRTYDLQGREVSGSGKGLVIKNGRVTFEK